jgi:hypothetical protein
MRANWPKPDLSQKLHASGRESRLYRALKGDVMTENQRSAEDITANAESLAVAMEIGQLVAQGELTADQASAHINLYHDMEDFRNLLIREEEVLGTLSAFKGIKNPDNNPVIAEVYSEQHARLQAELSYLDTGKAALAAQAVSNMPNFGFDGFASEKVAVNMFMDAADMTCDVVPLDPKTLKPIGEKSPQADGAIMHLQNCRLAPDDVPEPLPRIIPAPREENVPPVPSVRA